MIAEFVRRDLFEIPDWIKARALAEADTSMAGRRSNPLGRCSLRGHHVD